MTDRQLRARILLTEAQALGISLSDLIAADTASSPPVPTVAGYISSITASFSPGTSRTYRPYWRLTGELLGRRRLDDVTVGDLQAVVDEAARCARRRRPDSTGRASRESCVAALRAPFARAVAAGLVLANPAAALVKPRRSGSRRHALTDNELAELIDAIRTTSGDPDLDLLLVRFHLESGARREGALNLRCRDLDPRRSTVWLREKGDSEREQPISPSLAALLERHAASRGACGPDDAVFRSANGRPLSRRRYNTIFDKARPCLDWAQRTPVSAHVLRHTAITAVGRLAGYPVAQAFAGHRPPTVTGTYLHATLTDVATTIASLTAEDHPLADRNPWTARRLRRSGCHIR